jgi:hypothetical protein
MTATNKNPKKSEISYGILSEIEPAILTLTLIATCRL